MRKQVAEVCGVRCQSIKLKCGEGVRLSTQKEYPSFEDAVYDRVEGPRVVRSESDPLWKPTAQRLSVMRSVAVRRFRAMTDVHGEEHKVKI